MTPLPSPANSDRNSVNGRLDIDYLLEPQLSEQDDIQEVISGLSQTPKVIPPRYFYDAQGSQLFEAICELPEYYPTRTEASILQQYAPIIIEQTQVNELIELGSGSSTKTRYLFDAYGNDTDAPLYYIPVDVSQSILQESSEQLLIDYPQLKIRGKVATYSQALAQLATSSLGKRMIVFLGSSIGNFTPQECNRLMSEIISALNPGDYFLLGIDLHKSVSILEAAYNDAQGVTAKFNLNMLQHLNQRFAANFNLDSFKHQAIYNQTKQQIEMYLISQQQQEVNLSNLDLTIKLAPGERILTEISRKFNLETMSQYLGDRFLNVVQSYTDAQQLFALLLCQYKLK
ncbi:MAG: L-histidine N(alpha)-methyltransferase [Cyanobacteria bacterium J06621_8]